MRKEFFVPIVLALLLAAGGYGAYLYTAHKRVAGPSEIVVTEDPVVAAGFPSAESSPPNDTQNNGPLAPARTPPAGQLDYRNEHYRFELFYPSSLKETIYDEGQGASTITFENDQSGIGFQVFITPYGARQVSQERFKKDEPSGVIESPQPIQIDGALANMFFSQDSLLGPTREVWFIHGGYLYEVNTPKSEDAALAKVMATWQFI